MEGGVWAGGFAARPHPYSLVSPFPRRRAAWEGGKGVGLFRDV